VQLVSDVGIWKIVAHISFKLYSVAPGSFSTASTVRLSAAAQLCPFAFTQNRSRAAVGLEAGVRR
jgi:hypothetical protein